MEGFGSSPVGQKQEITTSLMDAFYHTREAPPEFGFGTSVRPPLNDCEEAAPGPGAYTIKTTVLGDVPQSSIRSAPQFSLRSREKFGNPMLKAVDPTTMLEPGPGHYKARVVNPQEDCAPKYYYEPASPTPFSPPCPGRGVGPVSSAPARRAGPRARGRRSPPPPRGSSPPPPPPREPRVGRSGSCGACLASWAPAPASPGAPRGSSPGFWRRQRRA